MTTPRCAPTVWLVLALVGAAPACGEAPTVVFVSLQNRPTVGAVATLHVEVANGGTTVTRDFTLPPGEDFPTSFTVTPAGRTGDITFDVAARDADGAAVARGRGAVTIQPGHQVDLTVVLDPEDFLVNASAPASQYLSGNPLLAGRQLAVRSDGSAMVAWQTDCQAADRCDIFARRFDASGRPVSEPGQPDELIASQLPQFARSPAVAASDQGYMVTWAGGATPNGPLDVHAALLDARGENAIELEVSGDPLDEGSVMPIALTSGDWVVIWERVTPAAIEIRARIFHLAPSGLGDSVELLVTAADVSNTGRAAAAALADGGFVVVWAQDGGPSVNVRARVFDAAGEPTTLDDLLLSSYPDGIAFNPHVAGLVDGGFVVAWHAFEANDPVLQHRPVMARVVDTDGHMSSEIVVAAETNSDPGLVVPAVAVRQSDGAIAVTWADLGVGSDGNGAAVRMRLLRENGMPSGDAFVANTTQVGDQFGASVAAVGDDAFLVAWTDGSMTPPDTSGNGLRARYLYATLDRHDGIIGARCGAAGDADCVAELTCAADASGTRLCHPSCADPDGAPCAAGGTCTGGACAF